MSEPQYRRLQPGDPVPNFKQRTSGYQNLSFDFAGGRYVLFCFFGTSGDERGQRMLQILERGREVFDGKKCAFFGVTVDKRDETRVKDQPKGIFFFYDFDQSVSKLYGAVAENTTGPNISLRRHWLVLDPNLHVRAVFDVESDGADVDKVLNYMRGLPPLDEFVGFKVPVPIIVLPNVFEPEFCRKLIGLHQAGDARSTGFMRDVDGKTVEIQDPRHKVRTDFHVEDIALQTVIQQKLARKIVPEIKKVHQFDVTRMERFLIGCYDSETGGHFGPHRDNTTLGTAHRRFAVSINLNSEFEGGEVGFPEFGPSTFKPPAGGAVVFSCSLLHWVSPVQSGKRYAFLPFLYDEAGAEVRAGNRKFVAKPAGVPDTSQAATGEAVA